VEEVKEEEEEVTEVKEINLDHKQVVVNSVINRT